MASPAEHKQHDEQNKVASLEAQRSEESRSVPGLFRHLVDDATILIRKELALAASEISHAVNDMKKGVGGLIGGAAVLQAGLIFLLGAAALGLMVWMEPWAAVLTVGVIATVIGLVMVRSGQNKLKPEAFVPRHTTESLRKDQEAARRHTP